MSTSATPTAPILPDCTLARLLAGLEARQNPNGTLTFTPRPSARDRAIIRANKPAVVRLLGLGPVAEGESTGDDWLGAQRGGARAPTPWRDRRDGSDFTSIAASIGERFPESFTFAALFPKRSRYSS